MCHLFNVGETERSWSRATCFSLIRSALCGVLHCSLLACGGSFPFFFFVAQNNGASGHSVAVVRQGRA